MWKFIVLILCIAIASICIRIGKKFDARKKKYIEGMNSFLEKCKFYDGIVLDVTDVPVDGAENIIHAVILQFRDEEQHRTIVHRYTGSGGKRYWRGDKIRVYYCEETDSVCIKEDNPFGRNAFKCGFIKNLLNIAAAVLVLFGIICLFL